MKRRTKNAWLSIVLPSVLGVGLIAAFIWGITMNSKAQEYETATKSMFSQTYSELVTELNELEVTLSKIQVVGSKTQYILLLDDIWRSCGTCTGLLSRIPASHVDTVELNQFLTRVGDYAHTLSTSLLHGEIVSSDDVEQLYTLRNTCNEIAQKISDRYTNGDLPTDILSADGYFESASDSYESEEARQKYPTLIYDGPFSESAEKAEPKGLHGDEITRTDAYSIAMSYMKEGCGLDFSSDSDGDIPSYDFTGQLPDGRSVDISITKQGGALVWFMTQATSDVTGVPDEETLKVYEEIALEFLDEHDYKDMKSTYAQFYDGVVLINFAATDGDIILYNDLVKVWVDRASGEVLGCDARNYIYSHVERDIKDAEITKKEARLLVSENLDIKQTNLALIPVTPEQEVLCYEFKGECAGEQYIVYINAWTGEEQQIFRIINTEDGALVV